MRIILLHIGACLALAGCNDHDVEDMAIKAYALCEKAYVFDTLVHTPHLALLKEAHHGFCEAIHLGEEAIEAHRAESSGD